MAAPPAREGDLADRSPVMSVQDPARLGQDGAMRRRPMVAPAKEQDVAGKGLSRLDGRQMAHRRERQGLVGGMLCLVATVVPVARLRRRFAQRGLLRLSQAERATNERTTVE